MRKLLIVLALILTPTAALGTQGISVLSVAKTGINGGSINSTLVSSVFNMAGTVGYFNKLSLLIAMTWGTSTDLDVTCEGSIDNSTYYWLARCTDAATHNCAIRKWQFSSTDGTNFSLDIETNGFPYVRCTFDDPGSGNGTLVLQALRGE